MRTQNYGRVVVTTSASGIYGNFGQSNYGAAKSGVVGLMNVLALEGQKNNVRVNALAPTAATAMTASLLDEWAKQSLKPESVTPGLLFLVSDEAPTGIILGAGAGCFAVARMLETQGVCLQGDALTPEAVAERFDKIGALETAQPVPTAFEQTFKYIRMAGGPGTR
jgi:hypothetical protein